MLHSLCKTVANTEHVLDVHVLDYYFINSLRPILFGPNITSMFYKYKKWKYMFMTTLTPTPYFGKVSIPCSAGSWNSANNFVKCVKTSRNPFIFDQTP